MCAIKDDLLEKLDFQNKEIVANEPKIKQRVPQCYDNGTPLGRELVNDTRYYKYSNYLYNEEY